jgi:hypothetical protein
MMLVKLPSMLPEDVIFPLATLEKMIDRHFEKYI